MTKKIRIYNADLKAESVKKISCNSNVFSVCKVDKSSRADII